MSKKTRLTRITERSIERRIEVLEEEVSVELSAAEKEAEIEARVQEIMQSARYILAHQADYAQEQREAEAYIEARTVRW